MPTARANISAKFIAQIVIPVSRVPIQSAPAVATSPAIESKQRDAGGRKRAERDEEHGQCQRPGHDLGAQHCGLVLLVELRPERRRAGDRQLDTGGGQALEPVVHAVRRADHLGRVRASPAPHHGHVARPLRWSRHGAAGAHRPRPPRGPTPVRFARRRAGRAGRRRCSAASSRARPANSCHGRRSGGRSTPARERTPSRRPPSRRPIAPARPAARRRRAQRPGRPTRGRRAAGDGPPKVQGDRAVRGAGGRSGGEAGHGPPRYGGFLPGTFPIGFYDTDPFLPPPEPAPASAGWRAHAAGRAGCDNETVSPR